MQKYEKHRCTINGLRNMGQLMMFNINSATFAAPTVVKWWLNVHDDKISYVGQFNCSDTVSINSMFPVNSYVCDLDQVYRI